MKADPRVIRSGRDVRADTVGPRSGRTGLGMSGVFTRTALAYLTFASILAATGCARERKGPPPIAIGTPCARCGMEVGSRRFACEREVGDTLRVYDSIECLLRDTGASAGGTVYLPDYDQQALHAAESLWVVRGSFETPMGGGLAAFLDRAAADELAGSTRGRVGRLADFAHADGAPQ